MCSIASESDIYDTQDRGVLSPTMLVPTRMILEVLCPETYPCGEVQHVGDDEVPSLGDRHVYASHVGQNEAELASSY